MKNIEKENLNEIMEKTAEIRAKKDVLIKWWRLHSSSDAYEYGTREFYSYCNAYTIPMYNSIVLFSNEGLTCEKIMKMSRDGKFVSTIMEINRLINIELKNNDSQYYFNKVCDDFNKTINKEYNENFESIIKKK